MTQWTKQEIFAAVDEWLKVHGELPNSVSWNASSDEHPRHPAFQTIWTRFGSLDNFLHQYRYRRRYWTQESIVASLQEWHRIHNRPPTTKDLRIPKGYWLPGVATVTRRFGSWGNALEAAGFTALPNGVSRRDFERFLPMPKRKASA